MDAIPPGKDLSAIPLASNPNGDPPNFVNPPSQADTALGFVILFIIISTFIVSVRLPTNFRNARKLGVDDYICLLAQILMTTYAVLAMSFKDTFRHVYDIPISVIDESYVKRQFALTFIVGPTLWSSKASILALYLRLFGPKLWLRYISYATLVITFLFYWAQTPLSGVLCTPRHGDGWDFAVLSRCSKLSVMGPIHGAVSVAADILLFILPLPVVYGLNLPPRKKLGLLLVFFMGFSAVVASSVALYYRVTIYTGTDKFWNSGNVITCTVVDGFVTIMVSCAPAMSSLWVNTFTKSAFYLSLRSGILSWSTRWTSVKDASVARVERKTPQPGSSPSKLTNSNGYYELREAAYVKPGSGPLPLNHKPSGEMKFIQNSIMIL